MGIVYDTAMEEELRSGKAHALVTTALASYVDTLAESVAVTEWNDESSSWAIYVATNRGCFESPGDPESANQILDEPQYGLCNVTLPRHRKGEEFQVKKSKSKSRPPARSKDDSLSATIDSEPLPEVDFLAGITDLVKRSRQQDLLVFVHGFTSHSSQPWPGRLNWLSTSRLMAQLWPTAGRRKAA